MRIAPLALLALSACSGGKSGSDGLFDEDMACESQPWDWYSDLVSNLMQADEEGDFTFTPPQDYLSLRDGGYDLEDGDFSWTDTYTPGFYYETAEVEGYGTVYTFGDIDLLYVTTYSDVLGESWGTRVRTEREGCEGSITTWDVDAGADPDEDPSDEGFTWEYEITSDDKVVAVTAEGTELDGAPYEATREYSSDLRVVTELDWDDGAYLATQTSHGDGTADSVWEQHDGEYDVYGTAGYSFAGDRSQDYEVFEAGGGDKVQACAYTVDYAGDGGGSCSYLLEDGSWLDCDLELGSDGSCTLSCGEYGDYDCS